jgi:hypothetical protein
MIEKTLNIQPTSGALQSGDHQSEPPESSLNRQVLGRFEIRVASTRSVFSAKSSVDMHGMHEGFAQQQALIETKMAFESFQLTVLSQSVLSKSHS